QSLDCAAKGGSGKRGLQFGCRAAHQSPSDEGASDGEQPRQRQRALPSKQREPNQRLYVFIVLAVLVIRCTGLLAVGASLYRGDLPQAEEHPLRRQLEQFGG